MSDIGEGALPSLPPDTCRPRMRVAGGEESECESTLFAKFYYGHCVVTKAAEGL